MRRIFKKGTNKTEKTIYFLGILFFIVMVVMLLRLLLFHLYNFIDSDMSSELILSKLLSEEHRWISPNWYYSTELRVINTQLISSLIFRFTNNWQIVRVCTSLILYIFLISAYIFMMKVVDVRTSMIILTAPMLLVPFSYTVLKIIQLGLYYIPHMILLFLLLGCYFKSDKKRIAVFAFFSLAFLMGLGGIRYILIAGIPIVCTSFILLIIQPEFANIKAGIDWNYLKKTNIGICIKRFLRSISGFAFFCAGYLVNSLLLSKWYSFDSYNKMYFNEFEKNEFSEIFSTILADILNLMGYRGAPIFSLKGFLNILLILGIFLILIYFVRRLTNILTIEFEKSFLILFFIISLGINIFTFIFVSDIYVDRYLVPELLMIIPVICICLNEKLGTLNGGIGITLFLIFGILAGSISITDVCNTNLHEQRYAPIEFLLENNFKVGYATFWNANIMTEISNGELLVTGVFNATDKNVFKYLTPKSLYEEERTKAGRSFVLLTTDEAKEFERDDRYKKLEKIYQDESFVIFSTNEKIYYE